MDEEVDGEVDEEVDEEADEKAGEEAGQRGLVCRGCEIIRVQCRAAATISTV